MAIFDNLKNNMYDITAKVMGYNATWTNSVTFEVSSAVVHFKQPTETEGLAGLDYIEGQPIMEYRAPFFEGLKEAADELTNEPIIIESKGAFYVRQVLKKFDGATFWAVLVEQE